MKHMLGQTPPVSKAWQLVYLATSQRQQSAPELAAYAKGEKY
jgi:hypothetical protein